MSVTWSKKAPRRIRRFRGRGDGRLSLGANPRNWPHGEDVLVLRGIGTGILWGALGAVVGSIATAGRGGTHETTFLIEGMSDEQVQETLVHLKKYPRIRS